MWLRARPQGEEERRPATTDEAMRRLCKKSSVEVAAQTAVSDTASNKAVGGKGGRGRRRGQGHGTTAEVVASADVALWDGCEEASAAHVARQPLRFCRCSRRNCMHLYIEWRTFGSTQLGP